MDDKILKAVIDSIEAGTLDQLCNDNNFDPNLDAYVFGATGVKVSKALLDDIKSNIEHYKAFLK